MIGELYEGALEGRHGVEVEDGTGRRNPLPVKEWMVLRPGDQGLLDRCDGPTLDVGSGPGRLTVAGGPALCRDVFGRVPGTGIWTTLLPADGNIGIGGDPRALLDRAFGLLAVGGRVLAEVMAPGTRSYADHVRLRTGHAIGEWFPWAWAPADDIAELALECGLAVTEVWEEASRWFVALSR